MTTASACLPTIRPLVAEDAEQTSRLSSLPQINWGETKDSWKTLIAASKGFAYAMTIPNKKQTGDVIIATVLAVPFDRKTRISSFIVHPDCQKRGLGRKLFGHLLNAIQNSTSNYLELEGSTAAKHLYETNGFKVDYEVVSFSKELVRDPQKLWQRIRRKCEGIFEAIKEAVRGGDTRRFIVGPKDLKMIAKMDEETFGASRAELLEKVNHVGLCRIFVDKKNDEVEGFVMSTEERNGVRIGPWVHKNSQGAAKVLNMALNALSRQSQVKSVTVNTANKVAVDILQKQGFIKEPYTTYHMHRELPHHQMAGNHPNNYAIWSFSLG